MTYTNTMVLFDEFGKLQVYGSTEEILKNHFKVRKEKYQERHNLLLTKFKAEASRASNRARFVCEVIEKKISIMDLKKKAAIDLMIKKGYDSDPMKAWAAKINAEKGINVKITDKDAEEEAEAGRDFNYILNMPIFSFTREKKEQLLKEAEEWNQKLKKIQKKTHLDLWKEDLENFMIALDEVEKVDI